MTGQVFLTGMRMLGRAFSRELDKPTLRVYEDTLSKLSDPEYKAAVKRALAKCEFFPVPAKLLELAEGRSNDMAETTAKRLEAMKVDESRYPTPEQLVEMRNDWRKVVKGLAEEKAADAVKLRGKPMSQEELDARKAEIAAQVAARLGEKADEEATP